MHDKESNGANKRRRTSLEDDLHITHLPDGFLADVAAYLSKPSRALFSAAMTAPSASWCSTSTTFNRTRQPSTTSRAIISSQQNQWGVLDFVEIEKSLARKLTDDDVGAVLASTNARQTLKKLKLTGCVSITGHGLAPLRGSACLEQIDLSLVKQHEKANIEPEPLISEAAILPILDSIIDTTGCSLKYIVFPWKWRHSQFPWKWRMGEMQNDMNQFLERYNQLFVNRRLSCSSCNTSMEGQPWITGTHQNNVCYSCLKQFCCDNCANDDDRDTLLLFCGRCDKDYVKSVCQWQSVLFVKKIDAKDVRRFVRVVSKQSVTVVFLRVIAVAELFVSNAPQFFVVRTAIKKIVKIVSIRKIAM